MDDVGDVGDGEDDEYDGVMSFFAFPLPRPLVGGCFFPALATFFPFGGMFQSSLIILSVRLVCSLCSCGMSSCLDEHHIYSLRSRDPNTSQQ